MDLILVAGVFIIEVVYGCCDILMIKLIDFELFYCL